MRNLKLIYSVKKEIQDFKANSFILVNNDNDANELYLNSGTHIASLNLDTNNVEELFEVKSAIDCEYLFSNNEICVATEEGEVYVLNLSTKNYELITFCQDGIEKMSWSPDQDVLVFITKSKKVVVMTSTYEPINESNLDDTEFGEQNFINIGWGKKETQFHGSEGKRIVKNQNIEFSESHEDKEHISQMINVTWRGDSELFAVSFFCKNERIFKIYNKEGVLQYTSEHVKGLENCIAWKPSGSLIAIPHQLPNKSTIALFEKNGLRHSEIVLPFSFNDEHVVNVAWSADSDILSIETQLDDKSRLYMYTTSNYHWYLKQFLKFNCKIIHSAWCLEINDSKTFHILLENGNYLVYKWCYETCFTETNTLNGRSFVCVIDGSNLLLTDFRNNIIPPPMCTLKINNNSNVNVCGFLQFSSSNCSENRLFTYDCDNQIKIFELKFETIRNRTHLSSVQLLLSLIADKESEVSIIPLTFNQLLWLNDATIVCYEGYNHDEHCSKINLIKLKNENFKIESSITVPQIIGNITHLNSDTFLIHSRNGQIQTVTIEDDKLKHISSHSILPEFCKCIKTIKSNGNFDVIGYSDNQNLYVNKNKISSNVTSFFITKKYLAFTQINSLKFSKISENFDIMDERKIERGGRLVIIIPMHYRSVLQMPRGNLETINPRILLIDSIGDLLDQLKFNEAMEILLKNRVNLNILFDHNPKLFIENIDCFLNEISNLQWLNLFINDLKNEDFTQTLYANNYSKNDRSSKYPVSYDVTEKINFICKTLCNRMDKRQNTNYILPIITSYLKVGNLERALEIIWNERKKEQIDDKTNDIKCNKIKTNRSEDALKYLLYLIDVDDLFNVALGMYDFNLVLFIGHKSQKDPKEYVLFLNELKQFDENYRKFKIDEHLKRYERALENIAKCKEEERFEECLKFVQKHQLYQKALKLFENNSSRYKKIALIFADFLRSNGKHEDASLMYERGDDLQQAILSARHVLDWRRCLTLTKCLEPNNSEQLNSISLSLSLSLEQSGNYDDAFYLLKNIIGDFHKAVNCLLNGKLYLRAIFEAKIYETTLLDSVIRPHLLDYSKILHENICADTNLFIKYKNRLLLIRSEKFERDNNQNYENFDNEYDFASDTTSVASSKYSRDTKKTFRSSKNRRKHERKLLSLKEGNPFEDIALIDALHNHIMKIINQQSHNHDTCKALIIINCDNNAKAIQESFKYLLNVIKSSLDEIWIPEITTTQQFSNGSNIDYAQIRNEQRYALIDPQKRFKPNLDITNWELEVLK